VAAPKAEVETLEVKAETMPAKRATRKKES
jgi:hypothetical protein